jgi:hypothetical protein
VTDANAEKQAGRQWNGEGEPVVVDPLAGLKHLGPIALVGREKILGLARQPIVYSWQDIVVAGTVVVIAGPPAIGKTTLLFLVLGARANTGAPLELLAREVQPATPGQWLVVIEGEHSEASTARKLVRSLRLLDVDDVALGRLIIVARKAVQLGSPQWLEVSELVARGLVSDIAIDTIARIAPADANDERQQVAIFAAVAEVIERAPAGVEPPIVWCVAHTRKNNTSGDVADVAGSTQRVGQADTVLLVSGEKCDGRVVSTKVTFGKLREEPDVYPQPVSFSIVTGVSGAPVLKTDVSAATDDGPLEQRILALLELGPKTKSALCTALGRSGSDVEEALTALFGERAIRTGSTRIGGRDRKTFELVPKANSNGSNDHVRDQDPWWNQ